MAAAHRGSLSLERAAHDARVRGPGQYRAIHSGQGRVADVHQIDIPWESSRRIFRPIPQVITSRPESRNFKTSVGTVGLPRHREDAGTLHKTGGRGISSWVRSFTKRDGELLYPIKRDGDGMGTIIHT